LFTSVFERHARRVGVSEAEVMQVVSMLAENPMAGDLIPGTGGARKVRVARTGQGKTGDIARSATLAGRMFPFFFSR